MVSKKTALKVSLASAVFIGLLYFMIEMLFKIESAVLRAMLIALLVFLTGFIGMIYKRKRK